MKVDAKSFIRWAGRNGEKWCQLEGTSVNHRQLGTGQIVKTRVDDRGISIYMKFYSEPGVDHRCFSEKGLELCDDFDLSEKIARQVLAFKSNAPVNPPEIRYVHQRLQPIELPMIDDEQDQNPQPLLNDQPTEQYAQPLFERSQEVCLRNTPSEKGIIVNVRQMTDSNVLYDVFFSTNDNRTVRESDLRLWNPEWRWGNRNDLLRDLAVLKLKNPQSDSLYALYASRTKFEVYQFKPAVKFLANPDQRLLIADEVGLGKTIEAGIIYLELQARLDLDQVLIVCPSSLKQKWQDELQSRFDEKFDILNTQQTKSFLDRYAEGTRLRGIVSLEAIRLRPLAEKLIDKHFDLVIIDEAHHCRNTSTLANAVASTLVENADAALLLTATPLQMGQADLFNLLNILSPGEFDNFESFINRLEPNTFINRAASYLSVGDLRSAAGELAKVEKTRERRRFQGNPYYQKIMDMLTRKSLTQQEMVTVQRRLIELNTLASIFTRTRKRDILEHSPLRTAQTLTVHFTREEIFFYNQVIEEARQDFEARHISGWGSGWVTIMKERQVASCISAVLRRRSRNGDHEDFIPEDAAIENEFGFSIKDDNQDWEYDPTDLLSGDPPGLMLSEDVKKFRVGMPVPQVDSKFEVFWSALNKVLAEDNKSKVIVFSYFRDTIDYLAEQLNKRNIGVRAIHGGYAVLERNTIIEEFRSTPEIRVLISSDVGSEGLDFQFCDTLFNYDLPWNPMKVEQRIGRIDRFGQMAQRIRIYNLVIEDSIESRILMRLYERIEIFKHSIGDIEEILGEQIRELTQLVFSKRLTPREEISQAIKSSEIILKRKQEIEEFEDKKLQFLGQEAIFSTTIEKTIESGKFISEVELQVLVSEYVKEQFTLSSLKKFKGDEAIYELHPNDDLVIDLKTFVMQRLKNDATALQFLKKLRSGKEIPLTFNSELAFQRKLLEFITPRHPLARAAMDYWEHKSLGIRRISQLRVASDSLKPDDYVFFLFSLDSVGVDRDSRLIPVCVSMTTGDVYNDLNKQFMRLIQTCSSPSHKQNGVFTDNRIREFEDNAFRYMQIERDILHKDLLTSNEAIVNARLNAVEQSYLAKKRCVENKRNIVANASIKRMYDGQLRNMDAKHRAKLNEINEKNKVDVTFSLLLKGYVEVVNHA